MKTFAFHFLWMLFPALTAFSQDVEPPQSRLFDSGQEGYPRYRIPVVIAAPNGDVLAFCEGRVGGGGFTGDIDIVMKRSTDSGKTWGPLEKIADDGPNTFGYPMPVVERESKTLWLFFTRSIGSDLEKDIVAGQSQDRTRVFAMSSPDSGRTWTPPADLSASLRRQDWTWYGLGSGIGLQLKNGRLVLPAYHNVEGSKDFSSHLIISDDRGRTWKIGESVGGQTGECTVAERRNGSLMLNSRNQTGENWSYAPFGPGVKPDGPQYRQRLVADSTDSGETWGEVRSDPELPEPVCQGMLYSWPEGGPDGRPLWLFANPAGPKRQNLTIRVSRDEGDTWPAAKLLHRGSAEYSCLIRLPDGDLGVLHERWEDNNIRIYWAKTPLSWLLK